MDLAARIRDRQGRFVLFALTPPRRATAPERVAEIAEATKARLRPLDLDGLVLYDIDDESSRNPSERPFPFTPTLDPAAYLSGELADWETPVVVYRAVGKYDAGSLERWVSDQDPGRTLSVLVGAASSDSRPPLALGEAQELATTTNPDLLLGGVAIPERHTRRGNEHERLLAKQAAGCRFFVTQVVYDVNAAKNLVSDYAYACRDAGIAPVPVVFTFSVCGSMKTLEFLRWLGVDVPRWIENDLRHAEDTLQASFEQALDAATELVAYCERLGVPYGLNVESVSIRKVEIDASVELARRLIEHVRRPA
ncbi:hypothetical protein GCM10011584_27650 [Nocardioides phosphati]|uniref:Methylenetetrahydrofolate reductase n=1 Tax=Nocardioides phosphati TaxID=1867775 RepID=A0ABQ2NE61_9ACTN|nr:methylenetetrahydrofolate reductase [Nocardioides phosphati]GGO92073.1 hypothetical protein GCM10011584_27650 [Nocardioides phosphati]